MAVMVAADVDAPAVVKERLEPFEPRIIIAAEITIESPDFGHLEAVFDAALRNLERSGASDRPAIVVADAGYWHKRQMESIVNTARRY